MTDFSFFQLLGYALLFFVVWRLLRYCYQRLLVPNPYAWLQLLSHTEWKLEHEVRNEMEQKVRSIIKLSIIRSDLMNLLGEHLVEQRMAAVAIPGTQFCLLDLQYRMTPGGLAKRHKQHAGERDNAPQGALPTPN